jgi:hypothetical protein
MAAKATAITRRRSRIEPNNDDEQDYTAAMYGRLSLGRGHS